MHNLLWNIALSTLLILSPSWLYFESKCQAWYDLICAKSDIKPQPTNPESKCWPSASYFPLLCWFSCHVNVLHLLQIKEKYATNRSSAYCLIATGATLLQCSVQNKTLSTHTHTRAHTTVLWPFYRDHPDEPVTEENFWTSWCKRVLTEADTPSIWLGATPSGLISAYLHHNPSCIRRQTNTYLN